MTIETQLETVRDLFGAREVSLEENTLKVDDRRFPVIDGVVVLLDPDQYPPSVKRRLNTGGQALTTQEFDEGIQFTFGEEWKEFSQILPEHETDFHLYFDLVDLEGLKNDRVCDLGCGSGRRSYFLKDHYRELILVDFSDAIFVARKNLEGFPNTLFFMADIHKLPFRENFADLIFSLGVLHHLPTDCMDEVRRLKPFAKRVLIYLYYALDNRPFYFRLMLKAVTALRLVLATIKSAAFRNAFTWFGAVTMYYPFVILGKLLKPFGLAKHVPLYEGYYDKGMTHIRQDVYDRFFTAIEQRVSRKQIYGLKDTYSEVTISDQTPYWHFLLHR